MESWAILCDILLVLLLVPCLALSAFVAIVTGGIGIAAARQKKGLRIAAFIVLVLGIGLGIYVGSAFIPREFWLNLRPSYHLGDAALKPFEHAVTDIDRASLDFTPISRDAEIKILFGQEGYVSCPDVELYIPDLPFKQQHICLKMVGDSYVWYSEYEVYLGPESWETLWFAYSSVPQSLGGDGYEPYTLVIAYRGREDRRFQHEPLSRDDVQPIIDEWRAYHLSHR